MIKHGKKKAIKTQRVKSPIKLRKLSGRVWRFFGAEMQSEVIVVVLPVDDQL